MRKATKDRNLGAFGGGHTEHETCGDKKSAASRARPPIKTAPAPLWAAAKDDQHRSIALALQKAREGSTRLIAGRSSGYRFSGAGFMCLPPCLPPRLPMRATHPRSGLLRRSSPVTAARPRPIFTAFPFGPRGAPATEAESNPAAGGCQWGENPPVSGTEH